MPDLLELEQEDFRAIDQVADAFLRATSSLDPEIDPPAFGQRFAREFARLAEDAVALALGLAARLRPRWEEYKRVGWSGQARQVHALRDSLLDSFEARLRHLVQITRIASRAATLTGRAVPGSERLPEAIREVSALKDETFCKWNSLEDLEQMLVDTFPLTAEQFDTLAPHYQPPQQWYEQGEQPF